MFSVMGGYYACSIRPDDVVYTSLPMYHTAAGALGIGMIFLGLKVALRRKFSASNFWNDCIKYEATVVVTLLTLVDPS